MTVLVLPDRRSLLDRLIEEAAAAMGIAPIDVAYRFDECAMSTLPTNSGWTASHVNAGGASVQSGVGTSGGAHKLFTTTNATDQGALYSGYHGRYADMTKFFFKGRVAFTGTRASGEYVGFGVTSNAAVGTLGNDNVLIGCIGAGSTVNVVVAKGSVGVQTYTDTGVAVPASGVYVEMSVFRNGSVLGGVVNGTPYTGVTTGIGTTGNAVLTTRTCGNGGLTSARELITDWDFYAFKRGV